MSNDPPVLDRSAVVGFQPATFLERGVAVSFTTPILLGSRIRPVERAGLELIIPNPDGGVGVHILPWASIPELCSPTLHDRQLWSVLSQHKMVSPMVVRESAQAIAIEGFAGHAASRAATDNREARAAGRVRTNFLLLLNLIRHTETRAEARTPIAQDTPASIAARARRALARQAPSLDCGPEDVASALENVACLVHHIGLPDDTVLAPVAATCRTSAGPPAKSQPGTPIPPQPSVSAPAKSSPRSWV